MGCRLHFRAFHLDVLRCGNADLDVLLEDDPCFEEICRKPKLVWHLRLKLIDFVLIHQCVAGIEVGDWEPA